MGTGGIPSAARWLTPFAAATVLAGAVAAAPFRPDLRPVLTCSLDLIALCPEGPGDAGLTEELLGRSGLQATPLPPVDTTSLFLPRVTRALIADVTARFARLGRIEDFLLYLGADAMVPDDLLAAASFGAPGGLLGGTAAIGAFPAENPALFERVGGSVLSFGAGRTAGRAQASPAVAQRTADLPFYLLAAGGGGGSDSASDTSQGSTPAAIASPVSGGSPTTGEDLSSAPEGTDDGGTGGGEGGPGGSGGSDDPGVPGGGGSLTGPVPVPLPIPGLLLACTLCGLLLARLRRNCPAR